MRVFGGILAGGIGTRMGATGGLPKQFLEVGGVPVVVRTLRRFQEVEEIGQIIIAMHPSWADYTTDLLAKHGVDVGKVSIVNGGETRFDSLVALAEASVRMADARGETDEVLLVNHDCARPFVTPEILRANIACAQTYDRATTSVPTIDTVLLSKDGKVSDCVPERSTVFMDQGPQTIRVRHFLGLVAGLSPEERAKYMEAGRLYIDKGYRVGIVRGDRGNFKLTTPFDLQLAEGLLKEGTVR